MDPTLQKRLIGAIILIVAAIVFVPMLLDGPGPAGTQTVDLGIPAPGPDGMRTEVIPLDAPLPVAPVADEGDVSTAPEEDVSVKSTPTPEAALGAGDPALAADPAELAPIGEVPPPVETAASEAVVSEHTADTSGRWHVTLGSYANADNARNLVADMRRAGLPAHAEPVTLAGKPALRVRIGPYADRVRAEAARLAVAAKRRDVTPALVQDEGNERVEPRSVETPASGAAVAGTTPAVARDPENATAPGAPVLRDARGWVVQIGAFAQVTEANAQVARLRTAGFAAFVDRLDAPRGTLHRVRIGPEAERAGADRLQASLKQSLGVDGVVMRHP